MQEIRVANIKFSIIVTSSWVGTLKSENNRMFIKHKQTFCLPVQRIIRSHVAFEVFIAVVMKSIIFWDMTPCSLLSCNRRFGGTYRLHLQGP
jgi:hypothetical protein